MSSDTQKTDRNFNYNSIMSKKNISGRVWVLIPDLAFIIAVIIVMGRDQLLLILVLGCYSRNTYSCFVFVETVASIGPHLILSSRLE